MMYNPHSKHSHFHLGGLDTFAVGPGRLGDRLFHTGHDFRPVHMGFSKNPKIPSDGKKKGDMKGSGAASMDLWASMKDAAKSSTSQTPGMEGEGAGTSGNPFTGNVRNPYAMRGKGSSSSHMTGKAAKALLKFMKKQHGLKGSGAGLPGGGSPAFINLAKGLVKNPRKGIRDAAQHMADEISDRLGLTEKETESKEKELQMSMIKDPTIRAFLKHGKKRGGNFWKKAGKALKKGFKKVGNTVKKGAKWVSEHPLEVLEFVESNPELLLLA